jgi:anti-sigma regulatory factor (Ser/Thr protein kinase)
MGNRLSLVLRNRLSELERMSEAVSAWCRDNAVSAVAEYQVNLALDEIVSNVILHGWKDNGEHQVCVSVSRLEDELSVEVEDDGMSFNPLEVPAPEIDQPLEKRAVGGLGIHLVRQLMDGLQYQQRDGKNLFVMKKKLGGT